MDDLTLATFCGVSERQVFVYLGWLQTYDPPASASKVRVHARVDSAHMKFSPHPEEAGVHYLHCPPSVAPYSIHCKLHRLDFIV